MHLTNYAINKKNEQFVANTCSGGGGGGEGTSSSSDAGGGNSSKWYLSQLQEHLTAQGHCWDKVRGRGNVLDAAGQLTGMSSIHLASKAVAALTPLPRPL